MVTVNETRYINPYTDFGFKKLFGTEFQKLFDQAEIAKYSDAERRQYEVSQKEYWDYTSTLETAERKGEKKRAEEMARKMKARGDSAEEIAEMTDLSIEQIERL